MLTCNINLTCYWREEESGMEEELFAMGILGFLFAFFAVFVVFIIIAIILYILMAIGLFKIAKRSSKEDLAWLAWIPIANSFLLALLVEDDVHPEIRGKFTLFYGIGFVVSLVFGSFLPFISFIPLIMFIYAFYFIAKKYSDNPVMHLVIAIITIGMAIPIQIFIFRNREPIINDVVIDSKE